MPAVNGTTSFARAIESPYTRVKPAVISASSVYTNDRMCCTTLSRRKPGLASPKLQTPRQVSIGQLRYKASISTVARPAFLPALSGTSLKVLLSRASRQSSASCAAAASHVHGDALTGDPPERPRKACVWPVWRWVLALGREPIVIVQVALDRKDGAIVQGPKGAAMRVSVPTAPTAHRLLPDWAQSMNLPQNVRDAVVPEWTYRAAEEVRKPMVYLPLSAALLLTLVATASKAAKPASHTSQSLQTQPDPANNTLHSSSQDSSNSSNGVDAAVTAPLTSKHSDPTQRNLDPIHPLEPASQVPNLLVSPSHDFTKLARFTAQQLNHEWHNLETPQHDEHSQGPDLRSAVGTSPSPSANHVKSQTLNPLPRHVVQPLHTRTLKTGPPAISSIPQMQAQSTTGLPTVQHNRSSETSESATAKAVAALDSMSAAAVAPTTPLFHQPRDHTAPGFPLQAANPAAFWGAGKQASATTHHTVTKLVPGSPLHSVDMADQRQQEGETNRMEEAVQKAIQAAGDAESNSKGSSVAAAPPTNPPGHSAASSSYTQRASRNEATPISRLGNSSAAGGTAVSTSHPTAAASGVVSGQAATDKQAATAASRIQPSVSAGDPWFTQAFSGSSMDRSKPSTSHVGGNRTYSSSNGGSSSSGSSRQPPEKARQSTLQAPSAVPQQQARVMQTGTNNSSPGKSMISSSSSSQHPSPAPRLPRHGRAAEHGSEVGKSGSRYGRDTRIWDSDPIIIAAAAALAAAEALSEFSGFVVKDVVPALTLILGSAFSEPKFRPPRKQ